MEVSNQHDGESNQEWMVQKDRPILFLLKEPLHVIDVAVQEPARSSREAASKGKEARDTEQKTLRHGACQWT
jgi:hypothetical protein